MNGLDFGEYSREKKSLPAPTRKPSINWKKKHGELEEILEILKMQDSASKQAVEVVSVENSELKAELNRLKLPVDEILKTGSVISCIHINAHRAQQGTIRGLIGNDYDIEKLGYTGAVRNYLNDVLVRRFIK